MQILNTPTGSVAVICAAFVLDRIVGDPSWIPHPVVIIGKLIAWFEKRMNRGQQFIRKANGVLLVLLTVLGTYFLTWGICRIAFWLNFWLGLVVTIWLLAATLASKCLAQAGREIYSLLEQGNLQSARQKLSWIVGRDTDALPQEEVVRGTVETVAENIVDGVTSPLFYGLIGGLPLAMAYKAVNTLDSMVGYKNQRYIDFGWASARLDDLANFIPARLTALALVFSSILLGYEYKQAWKIMRRDASKHPSPNSGYTESTVAGALGIRLGGYNSYGGVKSLRAYMGEPTRELRPEDIPTTIKLMYSSTLLFLLLGICVKLLLLR